VTRALGGPFLRLSAGRRRSCQPRGARQRQASRLQRRGGAGPRHVPCAWPVSAGGAAGRPPGGSLCRAGSRASTEPAGDDSRGAGHPAAGGGASALASGIRPWPCPPPRRPPAAGLAQHDPAPRPGPPGVWRPAPPLAPPLLLSQWPVQAARHGMATPVVLKPASARAAHRGCGAGRGPRARAAAPAAASAPSMPARGVAAAAAAPRRQGGHVPGGGPAGGAAPEPASSSTPGATAQAVGQSQPAATAALGQAALASHRAAVCACLPGHCCRPLLGGRVAPGTCTSPWQHAGSGEQQAAAGSGGEQQQQQQQQRQSVGQLSTVKHSRAASGGAQGGARGGAEAPAGVLGFQGSSCSCQVEER
jgi:hypothetical protein